MASKDFHIEMCIRDRVRTNLFTVICISTDVVDWFNSLVKGVVTKDRNCILYTSVHSLKRTENNLMALKDAIDKIVSYFDTDEVTDYEDACLLYTSRCV